MVGRRKDSHVEAELGDDGCRDNAIDSRDLLETLHFRVMRGEHLVDPLVDYGDVRLDPFDPIELDSQHEPVMLFDAAAQGERQLVRLLAQGAASQGLSAPVGEGPSSTGVTGTRAPGR